MVGLNTIPDPVRATVDLHSLQKLVARVAIEATFIIANIIETLDLLGVRRIYAGVIVSDAAGLSNEARRAPLRLRAC